MNKRNLKVYLVSLLLLIAVAFIGVTCNKIDLSEDSKVETRDQYEPMVTSTEYSFDFVDDGVVNTYDLLAVQGLYGNNEFSTPDLLVFIALPFGQPDSTNLYYPEIDNFTGFLIASSGAIFDYADGSQGVAKYTFSDEFPNNNGSAMDECNLTCLNTFKYEFAKADGTVEISYWRKKAPQEEFHFYNYHCYKRVIQ